MFGNICPEDRAISICATLHDVNMTLLHYSIRRKKSLHKHLPDDKDMLVKPLQISSLWFFMPLITAWSNSHTLVFRHGLALVIATSWVYHSNYDPIIRIIDVCLVNFMVLYHVLWGLILCKAITGNVCIMFASVAYGIWVHVIGKKNQGHEFHHDLWHMSIHLVFAIGSTMLIKEPLCLPR